MIIIIILLGVWSCQSTQKNKSVYKGQKTYVFLSHIYDRKNIIDKRIPIRPYSNEQLWIGGDLFLNDSNTLSKSLQFIENTLKIKSNNTHWALGNHDSHYSKNAVLKFINKPDYYAKYINGITLIVFNSNYYYFTGSCEKKNNQSQFITSVLDTIQKSSHVVLMSHHVIWGRLSDDSTDMNNYANTNHSDQYVHCNPNLKTDDLLNPHFNKLINNGIKILFIAGNFGQKCNSYEHINKNGIVFLGSGHLPKSRYNKKFNFNFTNDKILLFYHYPKKRQFNWCFISINKLLNLN